MKNYSIPVNGEQTKAYELVAIAKQNIATSSSKEEMRKLAEEFGSLVFTKWQALSLCFNYYQNDKVIPVAEKMSIFKEGVLNPKRNKNCSEVLKTKEEKPFWEIDTKKGQLFHDLPYHKLFFFSLSLNNSISSTKKFDVAPES